MVDWQDMLAGYDKQTEPSTQEKCKAWKTAIGLQDVDGLKPSQYLLDTAREHIEGAISIDEAEHRISTYYKARETRTQIEADTKEADIVSARIAKILGEKTFKFSPATWINIHKRLFEGVFPHAGKLRTYNFTKDEWVLSQETVTYASWDTIRDTMEYDFSQEQNFSYAGLSIEETIRHFVKFISNIWQIHPFCEGNTRATAVFTIKYLNFLGFSVNNEMFEKHSWFFRNALVRANYSVIQKGIYPTALPLEQFFCNLLIGTNYPLENRSLHIGVPTSAYSKNATNQPVATVPKCQGGTLDGTLDGTLKLSEDERELLQLLKEHPTITREALAKNTGKSVRTIARILDALKEKNKIQRIGGKRNGQWKLT